ncbi:hypothetical protein BH10BAC6_BH10BAC6_03250 [soil metagenome]
MKYMYLLFLITCVLSCHDEPPSVVVPRGDATNFTTKTRPNVRVTSVSWVTRGSVVKLSCSVVNKEPNPVLIDVSRWVLISAPGRSLGARGYLQHDATEIRFSSKAKHFGLFCGTCIGGYRYQNEPFIAMAVVPASDSIVLSIRVIVPADACRQLDSSDAVEICLNAYKQDSCTKLLIRYKGKHSYDVPLASSPLNWNEQSVHSFAIGTKRQAEKNNRSNQYADLGDHLYYRDGWSLHGVFRNSWNSSSK